MPSADMINGLFEVFGGSFLILNIVRLVKDKRLQGVHWAPTVFFTTWGIWNLYYYSNLDQWWSFMGGCFITMINTIWLFLIWYYSVLYPSKK